MNQGVIGRLESIAAKQLRFMAGDWGKLYYGLYANNFASGLSLLSFATAGEILKEAGSRGMGRRRAGRL